LGLRAEWRGRHFALRLFWGSGRADVSDIPPAIERLVY
jgi:hypothetical protein